LNDIEAYVFLQIWYSINWVNYAKTGIEHKLGVSNDWKDTWFNQKSNPIIFNNLKAETESVLANYSKLFAILSTFYTSTSISYDKNVASKSSKNSSLFSACFRASFKFFYSLYFIIGFKYSSFSSSFKKSLWLSIFWRCWLALLSCSILSIPWIRVILGSSTWIKLSSSFLSCSSFSLISLYSFSKISLYSFSF